jgi:long-chain acyl-CoA synthetase
VSIVHVALEHVPEALRAMRPTVIASVPRLFEKMRERIEAAVAKSPSRNRRLFAWAREAGRTVNLGPLTGSPRPGFALRLRYAVADRLVLRRVRAALGGRLRHSISGGAPLPRDVLEFFTCLGVRIVEGYGLTETSPVIAINDPRSIRPGTVGRPLPGTEVLIAGDGEVLVRGPGVMQGYFNDPEGSARALEGGWFHTGDIGALDADGYLSITDRKKDLIITSGGKNVAPQPIESALRATGLIAQAVAVGNARRFVSALLVPEREALGRLCEKLGIPAEPVEAAVARPEVLAAFDRAVACALRDFAGYEQVKRFTILTKEFSIEDGELTPTMKVKRRVVEEKHRAAIDAMYRDAGNPAS